MSAPGALLAKYEIAPPPRAPMDDAVYVRLVVGALAALDVPAWQRFECAGIACLETGNGDSPAVALHNHCGNKYKAEIVAEYRRRTHKPQHWFRAKGHPESDDPDEVIYLAWPNAEMFWSMWLWRHVGSASGVAPFKARYTEAGRRFWASDPTWIEALLKAEYRGKRTAHEPERFAKSVANHHRVVARCMRLVA